MNVNLDQYQTVRVSTGEESRREPGHSTLVPVFKVAGDGRSYAARTPVLLKVYREGEGYIAENEALDIVVSGESDAEAILDAVEMLAIQVAHYKSLEQNQVVGRAVDLRTKYRNNFELIA